GRDEPLIERMLQTYDLLVSTIDPQGWADCAIRRLDAAISGDLQNTELGEGLVQLLSDELADLKRRAISGSGKLCRMNGLETYVEHMNELLAIIQDWQARF